MTNSRLGLCSKQKPDNHHVFCRPGPVTSTIKHREEIMESLSNENIFFRDLMEHHGLDHFLFLFLWDEGGRLCVVETLPKVCAAYTATQTLPDALRQHKQVREKTRSRRG